MKYTNAQDILPKEVLESIYKYLDGGYLYIPRKDEKKKAWGESIGLKSEIKRRNLD